jgi:hypothetical protein
VKVVRFLLATFASTVTLLLVNMFLFPIVFPHGVAPKFANMRSEPILALHLVALVATAALLTLVNIIVRPNTSSFVALGIGAVAGLLASLPTELHTYALAEVKLSAEVVAVIWTTLTWSLASLAAHSTLRFRNQTGRSTS